ncbi:hypothetical protein HK105_200521 [Polyrhizophydium stewartii]|uniref:Uncharacterized protein n=1 Tax=Polyrhizophydium stewartii TaxID=2732419 RepID=A0ABR4NJJ0_9FUNG
MDQSLARLIALLAPGQPVDPNLAWSAFTLLRQDLVAFKQELLADEREILTLEDDIAAKRAAQQAFDAFVAKWTPVLARVEADNTKLLQDPAGVDPKAQALVDAARAARHGLSLEAFDAEIAEEFRGVDGVTADAAAGHEVGDERMDEDHAGVEGRSGEHTGDLDGEKPADGDAAEAASTEIRADVIDLVEVDDAGAWTANAAGAMVDLTGEDDANGAEVGNQVPEEPDGPSGLDDDDDDDDIDPDNDQDEDMGLGAQISF